MNTTFRYSDFTVNFTVHPVKGDISLSRDAVAIGGSIRNLLFTDKYERPFQPLIGAGIPQTLFNNIDPNTEHLIRKRAEETIAAYEKRAINVKIVLVSDPDRNGYNMTVFYTPINTTEKVQIDVLFKRIR